MSREHFRRWLGIAGSAVLLATGLTACTGQTRADLCWERATKEFAVLWKATLDAFPDRSRVLSVSDSDGCDSANSGAWLEVSVDPGMKRADIESALETVGWTKNVKKFIPCTLTCRPDMALQQGKRVIGLNLWKETDLPEDSSNLPWSLEIQAIDHCWTDDHYTY